MTIATIIQTGEQECQIEIGDVAFFDIKHISSNIRGEVLLKDRNRYIRGKITPNDKARGVAHRRLLSEWSEIKSDDEIRVSKVEIGGVNV